MNASKHFVTAGRLALLSCLLWSTAATAQPVNPASRPAANHLAGNTSPFLQQHADNPIAWHVWGQEAFDKAVRENKPIFLSIGYSTCHWCHVMERESFEDPAIASIINENFVPILVDREQRPDVDRIYVNYVMASRGSAGWPLNVFLTPSLKPFFGATYFLPVEMEGIPSFRTVLTRVAESWGKDRDRIVASADRAVAALADLSAMPADPAARADEALLAAAYDQFHKEFDADHGGFGPAPKFPPPLALRFLLHYYTRRGDAAAREMAFKTLGAMADGGIRDQIGGGFHRYATDARWFLPHFEKMLYDQAQLADCYLDAYQLTRDRRYAAVAGDILDYALRDMTGPEGQFFTAEDADSAADSARPEELNEGAFYVWTAGQIAAVVGKDAAEVFNFQYGVMPDGNVSADPRKEFVGKNVLARAHMVEETATKFGKSVEQVEASLKESRVKLLAARQMRPRPHRDEKAIAGWNGMMIGALARAGLIMKEPAYTRAAVRAANFLRNQLYDASSKTLYRSWRGDHGIVEAFAEDYAMVISGLIDLYENSLDIQWLKLAIDLQARQDALFWDVKSGGYFNTAEGVKTLVMRMKETSDGDMPSASSMAALNGLRLAEMTGDKQIRERAQKTLAAFAPALRASPASLPQMLVALDFDLSKPRQIVIAGKMGSEDVLAMQNEAAGHYLPNTVMLLADGDEGQRFLGAQLEFIRSVAMIRGRATAYVCENYTCQLPTTDLPALRRMLSTMDVSRRKPASEPSP